MPQDISPIPGMRIAEQVAYAAWCQGLALRDAEAAARDAIGAVGLDELAGRRADRVSGGQLRRVGLAEVLATNASVLLLDEPVAGLDPNQVRGFREILDTLTTAFVISTHQITDLIDVCNRVAVLVDGNLAFVGSIDDFLGHAPAGSRHPAESAFEYFAPGRSH